MTAIEIEIEIATAHDTVAAKSWPGERAHASSLLPPSFPSSEGPAKRRSTTSVWREHVAKKSGEAGRSGGGGIANAAGGNDGAAGGTVGERRSDLDSHVGRRRVSTDSRRRVESLAQGSAGSA